MSRAIGNFKFKKSTVLPAEEQMVTALPDVILHEITDDDEFLVIACDGSLNFILLLSNSLIDYIQVFGIVSLLKLWSRSSGMEFRCSTSYILFVRS